MGGFVQRVVCSSAQLRTEVPLAQSGRAAGCKPDGRGFKSTWHSNPVERHRSCGRLRESQHARKHVSRSTRRRGRVVVHRRFAAEPAGYTPSSSAPFALSHQFGEVAPAKLPDHAVRHHVALTHAAGHLIISTRKEGKYALFIRNGADVAQLIEHLLLARR